MPKDMTPADQHATDVSRRSLMKVTALAGGGFMLGVALPGLTPAQKVLAATPKAADLNAFVRILPDNSITIISAKTEMGQGSHTGIAAGGRGTGSRLEQDQRRNGAQPAAVR